MTSRKSSGKRVAAAGCLIAGLLLVVFFWPVLRLIWFAAFVSPARESVEFEVPGASFTLTHSRLLSHPFLAEFERDITYHSPGGGRVSTPLKFDTCGGYPINCYLIESAGRWFLRLDDAVSQHLLDLDQQQTYELIRVQDRDYIGLLNHDRGTTGWSVTNGDPSTLRVTINGADATPLEDLVGEATETYVGVLTGSYGNLRFLAADVAPEAAIRHLHDFE